MVQGEGYLTAQKVCERLSELNKEIEASGLSVPKGRGHRKPKIIRLRDELQELWIRWQAYEAKKKQQQLYRDRSGEERMPNHTAKWWQTQGMKACPITVIFRSMVKRRMSRNL